MCKQFLGKKVRIITDQQYGTYYEGTKYELNYGYVPNTTVPDGEGLDAYYISSHEPLTEAEGTCIAIIHRVNDDDDKLIIAAESENYSNEEIKKAVEFRERLFEHVIAR